MSDLQKGTGQDNPSGLQPMNFIQMSQDTVKAVYRAQIDKPEAVYTLTVTVAAPGSDQERQEVEQFMADIVASFELAPPPPAGEQDSVQEPVPFDPATGILIEPDIAEARTGAGPFGIAMTLQATVEPEVDAPPPGGAFAIRGVVLAGKDHVYRARRGRATATVTGLAGRGRISSPNKNVSTGGPPQSDSGPTVTVHGYTRFLFNLVGYFY